MFLYQKFNYNYKKLIKGDSIDIVLDKIREEKPEYVCFDTETDGLNIITSKSFLVSICFNKNVYTLAYTMNRMEKFTREMGELGIPLFAHNAKYDYHMVENGGVHYISDKLKIYDSITVARLTEFADDRESMSLENLGQKYVADDAKFAGKVIKDIVNKINKVRRDELRRGLIEAFPDEGFGTIKDGKVRGTGKLTETIDDYFKYRARYVNDDNPIYQYIDEHFTPANYKDVYLQEPDLMESYAADDVVILNEYLKKALPVLDKVEGREVLERESKLIPVIARMENVGLQVDIPYVLEARKKMVAYRDLLYWELEFYTGLQFSVGQHEFIKKLLKEKYGVVSEKADEKALKYIIEKSPNEECIQVCKDILELRTLDKWISTYVDGKLNSLVFHIEDCTLRIHTDMNNNGAVSGRVSCDMQQQPKNALLDRDGNELFHPRRMFVCPEGYTMAFIDKKLSI